MEMNKQYYLKHQKKMLKYFSVLTKHFKKVLKSRFSKAEIAKITLMAKNEYTKLFPNTPYIGGFENKNTANIVGSVIILSYINVLEKYGLKEREIGEIIYNMFELLFKDRGFLVKTFIKFFVKTKAGKKFIQKAVDKKAKYEKHEAAWITRVVEDSDYDMSFDLKSCGICKYYKELGSENYIKYICLGDFPMFNSVGLELHRENTEANGADVCTYRIKVSDKRVPAWPPENLPEWKY
ncbi:MAG: hypothetical protein CR988_00460 [Treponema sp.]|nr:MAG: hypothetical protein CR988_00460 [Treponema sp.]